MLPLLTSAQIREADAYTIANEPISAINLMERASKAFVGWFINHFPDKKLAISVYCGTGNNGGDGLAIARLLKEHQYEKLKIFIARYSSKSTAEFEHNLTRVKQTSLKVSELTKDGVFPEDDSQLIIDALLGTGLNKPLEGDFKNLVAHLNSLHKTVVAVDIPTGLFADGEVVPHAMVLKTELTITFQQPKINFLLPESGQYINCFEVVNIGISEVFLSTLNPIYNAIEASDIRNLIKPRHRFSNKGTYGHALIVAGEPETMGAALLCSVACAYAGAGLTTACIPQSGLTALNSYMPEIMAILRQGTQLPEIKWETFNSIGIGPGLGKDDSALALLNQVLRHYKKPVVLDADALNLLGGQPQLWDVVPANSILTPHMKEFDRLFGEHRSWWQRIETARREAAARSVYILLKNDYTIVVTPQGKVYFNTTGNPAMATGGMGDVLTGIITAMLAQNYSSVEACLLGAYLHGKAGDELALPNRMNAILPGALAARIPYTMAKLMA